MSLIMLPRNTPSLFKECGESLKISGLVWNKSEKFVSLLSRTMIPFIDKEGSDIFKVLLSDRVNFKLIKEQEIQKSVTVDIQSQKSNESIRKKQATLDSILNEIKENASFIIDIL